MNPAFIHKPRDRSSRLYRRYPFRLDTKRAYLRSRFAEQSDSYSAGFCAAKPRNLFLRRKSAHPDNGRDMKDADRRLHYG